MNIAIFLVLAIFAPFQTLQAAGLVIYPVTCNYLTPNCECPLRNGDGQRIDVCEFQLEISVIQSFTRYKIDSELGRAAPSGEMWIFNDTTGSLFPHPLVTRSADSACGPIDDDSCTEPYTADGYTFRDIIAINGRFPGPTIIVNQGQVLSINVTNKLDADLVSIHWHGLDQRNTNFMDGVEHVTQCGASPGASFRYIFEAAQTGTFWYHSHTGTQRTDGIFGALIFREPEELLNRTQEQNGVGTFQDLPTEHTLTLTDWQQKSSLELFTLLEAGLHYYTSFQVPGPDQSPLENRNSPDGAEAGPIAFWSALINGRSRQYSVNSVQSLLSIFTVSPNSQYRFRLIGAQGVYAFRVSIDGHRLKVIAMDGTFVKPRDVDFIILHSGERYDFLLETKLLDDVIDDSNFAIRAETLETGVDPNEPHLAEAILHYDVDAEPRSTEYADIFDESLRVSQSCNETNICTALNCPFEEYPSTFYIDCIRVNDMELLFPLDDSELPDVNVDDEDKVFLNFAFEGSGGSASINARSHILPSSPLALLNSDELANIREEEFCKNINTNTMCNNNQDVLINPECICTHVQELRYNKSIQLVISDINPSYDPQSSPFFFASHPIHLHGHQFHVVDIQYGSYDSNGMLSRANESIVCGGTNLCTNPSWREGKDYSIGKTGKISNTAPLKDTLFLPAGGHAVLYFKSDNPGYWYLHCHIEVHQLEGMAIIIAEAPNNTLAAPSDMNSCGNFTWTLEDFYAYLEGEPPTTEVEALEEELKEDRDLLFGLSIGLGSGLFVSLLVNVILLLVFCCCCCINRDSYNLKGA